MKKKKPYRLFKPGKLVATPGVLKAIPGVELTNALTRHLRGDWGDACDEDRASNDRAIKSGDRIFSVYHSKSGVKFWVITDRDRSATTILLPSEYCGGPA